MYIERSLSKELIAWKDRIDRKALILNGARQVGKSSLVRNFANSFQNFVEINFERNPEFIELFQHSLSPKELLPAISALTNKKIDPENTLLFFDEIQECPKALTSLRYFYEELPQLAVIGSGSLLKFQIEKEGLPVGRVEFLYLRPLSFREFLNALKEEEILQLIDHHTFQIPVSPPVHQKIISLLKIYFLIGGMPSAVSTYLRSRDLNDVSKVHQDLVTAYRADFRKYAKNRQIPHVEKTFQSIPKMIGQKFKYSNVSSDIRSAYISEALDLLAKAGIAQVIYHSSGNGIPLSAESNLKHFKVAFLDVGLIQNSLGLSLGTAMLESPDDFINKGAIAEQFVAQELLAYSDPHTEAKLFYWQREQRGSQAEVDYLIERKSVAGSLEIVPIEAKYGSSSKAKSLQIFLSEKNLDLGYKVSSENILQLGKVQPGKIRSLPLYFLSRIVRNEVS